MFGSIHYVDDTNTYLPRCSAKNLSNEEKADLWKKYWSYMKKITEVELFDFIAHPDLIKYISIDNFDCYKEDIDEALEGFVKNKKVIEFNSKCFFNHSNHKISNGMESLSSYVISQALEKKIALTVNDDAHHIDQQCWSFDRAEEYLSQFKNIKRFSL
jgi:histidinol phosphatase-like PHP family hydrolase